MVYLVVRNDIPAYGQRHVHLRMTRDEALPCGALRASGWTVSAPPLEQNGPPPSVFRPRDPAAIDVRWVGRGLESFDLSTKVFCESIHPQRRDRIGPARHRSRGELQLIRSSASAYTNQLKLIDERVHRLVGADEVPLFPCAIDLWRHGKRAKSVSYPRRYWLYAVEQRLDCPAPFEDVVLKLPGRAFVEFNALLCGECADNRLPGEPRL
jgi:hypothetical protein